jgi:elongation factor P
MLMQALELRRNTLVQYQGRICTVTSWKSLRNDRRQFVQMTLKDLLSGRVSELKEHGDTKYEVLESSQVDLAHSYRDGPDEVFYDPDGVEFRCSIESVKDALLWQADAYRGMLVDGKLITIAPPATVIATVAETAPPLKGANSGQKDALLDNGIKIRVSQLTQTGDRVRLDPETLEFKERV